MMLPHILQLMIKTKEMELLRVDASINEMERFGATNRQHATALSSALQTAKAARADLLGQMEQLNKECVEAISPPQSAGERSLLACSFNSSLTCFMNRANW